MTVSDTVLAALIAGVVSLVISIVSTYLTASFARRKFEREVGEKYRQKLYELRLQEYPAAFGITGRIVFDDTLRSTRDEIVAVMSELRIWWVGPAAPLLSKDAVSAYYNLNDVVKSVAACDGVIGEPLSHDLFQANKRFRLTLRQDLDVLYDSDEFNESLRRK